MSLPPADRVPLVKQQFRVGGEQPGLCEERGYHGPFLNTEIYNTMPGWEGMGDCVTCGSTCRATESPPDPSAPVRQGTETPDTGKP